MKSFSTADAEIGTGNVSTAQARKRLLIVDDDPSVRHSLWITFNTQYTIILAENGPKALEIFRKDPVDVAIVDIRMPGMSGIEVLSSMKEMDPHVEVIILTAYESLETAREALRLGACDYLSKPFRVDVLREAVTIAFDRRDVSRKTSTYDNKLAELQEQIHTQQMREELARTRNEIYASIIHDINGPLTVVAGYIDLIQHKLKNSTSLEAEQVEGIRKHAASISRQVTNCVELSRRYLGFLEGKVGSYTKAGVKEIFFDLAEVLKAHPQARSNELVIHFFQDEINLKIHGTDLLQVLVNLTVNALQCTAKPHRVEVYARMVDQNSVRQALQPGEDSTILRAEKFPPNEPFIAISVQDNGPGISKENLTKIFEPYFTTKPPGQGTGLGLSIVKRLVLQAEGAIHAYSHLGEGTVFTVYLPIAE
jgi:two-component system, sensor histidine kinase and response regulator